MPFEKVFEVCVTETITRTRRVHVTLRSRITFPEDAEAEVQAQIDAGTFSMADAEEERGPLRVSAVLVDVRRRGALAMCLLSLGSLRYWDAEHGSLLPEHIRKPLQAAWNEGHAVLQAAAVSPSPAQARATNEGEGGGGG